MNEIKAVILENIDTGEERRIETAFIDDSQKSLFRFGVFDEDKKMLICQYYNTYKYAITDVIRK